VIAIRDQLAPSVKLDIDEMGVILPDDNNPNVEQFPLVYWNAVAATYAYLFGRLSALNVDFLGMSQLVGYPTQFPSVSMLNWTTGAGTARYWTLQLLVQQFGNDLTATPHLMFGTYSTDDDLVFAQAFQSDIDGRQKLLIVNKSASSQSITLTPDWTSAKLFFIDESTGFGPAGVTTIQTPQSLSMNPFAVWLIIR